MTADEPENFNIIYHLMRGDDHHLSDETWPGLFENLADRIILDLSPVKVLDAGCGRGYLLKALRKRGVDAWGIDTSASAIQNSLPESQPYSQVGSIIDPFPHPQYDLIICIDIFEHVPPEETERAVENLCSHCETILLSCNPYDFHNTAHINIQPPELWTAIFNRFGFTRDIDFDGSYIAPWAMLFRKTKLPISDLLFTYEQKLWMLTQENDLRRNLSVEQLLELSHNEQQVQYWKEVTAQTQTSLNDVLNSASWRFMTRVQYYRKRFIPIGSRRESLMRLIFYGLKVVRREGPIGFVALAIQKLVNNIELKSIKLQRRLKLRSSNQPNRGQVCEIDGLVDPPKVEPHTAPVDIIICIHNALDDVQRCLASLLEHTSHPYRLFLVDDGSNEVTAQYLHDFADSHHGSLLRSENATGYTYAANRGMRASSAEFLVLLNSDTILTPRWLDRLVACIQNDQKVGIVGPLSNTASWQSVPRIEEDGDWASNPLPEGISPARMAELITSNPARLYLEMPLLNGFCLMIRRKLLDEVGLFDEENFGQGYGEEDDLVLRARAQGWKMAIADDVYIYHAQSKSYSSDQRHALSERAGKILRSKHGEKIISQGVHFCQENLVLEGIRARAQVTFDRDKCLHRGDQFRGKRLLFILPINTPGGGANVIRSESIAMQEMGVKVTFFNLEAHREGFVKSYPDLSLSTIFGQAEDLESAAQNYDAVIATYNPTVAWLKPLQAKEIHPILAYYVQGFEPWMYAQGTQGYKTALDSYTLIDEMLLFTKTEWTRQQVKESTGRECKVIGASVDIDLYRPRPRKTPLWPDSPLRIASMIRPESPYREPLKTMQLLHKTSQKYKGEVEIVLFGTPAENPAFQKLPHDFPWKLYGILSPEQVSNFLSQVDIFVDYSSHQAMGLTAMEAMACGCAVIVPQYGGASSYAKNEQNSLVVDSSAFENVWIALQHLIDDEKLRNKVRRNAIHDICTYFPEQAALNMLNHLFNG
jgi:GT2 family glycosyltransferase/glycosyltransferase involved in cell wall biosynthesis/SAM-dependent methyltransferase